MARNSVGGFAAYGNPNYVAGAAFGDAVGNAILIQNNFNDCMLASGWVIVDNQSSGPEEQSPVFSQQPTAAASGVNVTFTPRRTFPVKCIKPGQALPIGFFETPDECQKRGGQVDQSYHAGQTPVVAKQGSPVVPQQPTVNNQIQSAGNQMKACKEALRKKTEYAQLSAYLPDLSTNHFTFAQMADNNLPTIEEARLLVLYGDEANKCNDPFLKLIDKLNPKVSQIFRQVEVENRTILLLLIDRKITWGEASRRAQAANDAGRSNLLGVSSK